MWIILTPHFQVDMRKVNLEVMRPWIANKVTELVGFEDEVVIEYAMGLLEDKTEPVCDIAISSFCPLIASRK
jgi:hypothetical protein